MNSIFGASVALLALLQCVTGQAVLSLPRDLAVHDNTYNTSNYQEWQYLAGFCRDVDTGEPLSVFLSHFLQRRGPLLVPFTIFSASSLDTGDYFSTLALYLDPQHPFKSSEANVTDSSEPYYFQYGVPEGGQASFSTVYSQSNESWSWRASQEGDYALDLAGTVYSPGYLSPPTGLEAEGLAYNWNPETVDGLSYYLLAPNMWLEGTIGVGSTNYTVQCVVWHEHQWGNFNGVDAAFHYIWSYARFDNGDLLTFRQWCRPGLDCDPSMNRYAYLTKQPGGGYTVEHAAGPAATYTFTGFHEAGGIAFPVNGTLETPQGTWYVVPDNPDQVAASPPGNFWEGVTYLRAGSPEGPKVAKAFLELVDFNFTSNGQGSEQPPPITGGRPPLPKLSWLE